MTTEPTPTSSGFLVRQRKTPEQWHKKAHYRTFQMGVSFEDCWYCQRSQAHCKSKVTYDDIQTAVGEAQELNIKRGWTPPVRPYWCRNCELYHLARAKKRGDLRKVERARRKWLIARLDQG